MPVVDPAGKDFGCGVADDLWLGRIGCDGLKMGFGGDKAGLGEGKAWEILDGRGAESWVGCVDEGKDGQGKPLTLSVLDGDGLYGIFQLGDGLIRAVEVRDDGILNV
jgi:hypothetical protein